MFQTVFKLPDLSAQEGYAPVDAFRYKLPTLGKPRKATSVPTSFGKRIVTPAYFSR